MYNKRKRNNVVSFEELYEKGILSKHGLKEDSTFQNDFTKSAKDNKVVYYIRKLPEKYADIMLFYYVYGYTADEYSNGVFISEQRQKKAGETSGWKKNFD